ncbi:MAG: MFS transporter [Kiritimatiellae bacterium]|nr:MFS transporter [Kiritimatiellia bacterium]
MGERSAVVVKRLDYKWVMLAIVSLTYFLAQGTRQIYNAVLPQIKTDFASAGLSDLQLGLVGSAFTLVFGVVLMFSGLAADFFRRKWMIVCGTLIFSLGILGTGFANGLMMLVALYGVLNAFGQALLPPSNSSLISQFHVETRGTAFAVYQAAIYLGSILCCVAAGFLAGLGPGGWRQAFVVFGAIGVVWAVAAALFLKDTPNVGTDDKPSVREAFAAFASKPTALLLTGALGCYFYLLYGYKQWVPAFLSRAFPDLSTASVAFHAVFWFYLGAVVGVFLGGRVSDRLKVWRPAVRLEVEIVAILLSVPFLLLTAWAGSLPLMIAAIFAFGFATGIYDSNLYAAMLEVINPRYRAVATGIFGCGGCIFGAFGPGVMGWMNDHFTIRASFASLAGFALAGAALIVLARFRYFNHDKV